MANIETKNETRLIDLTCGELQSLIEQIVNGCFNSYQANGTTPEPDELLTVEQAAEMLTLSKATVYGLISQGKIPCMKQSKRVYFSKHELLEYLKAGRKKTVQELEQEAKAYLAKGKRKGGYHG